MKNLGIEFTDYEIVLVFAQGSIGYAFNKKVNPEILKKLQKAYDELFEEGMVMRIRNEYVNK